MGDMLLWLLVGHALADFSLQTEAMARGKNWKIPPHNIPPGQKPSRVWPYWMTAHAAIHAGAVALITGVWWLGALEFVCHWLIDAAKCANKTNIHADQALHVACKFLWILFLIWSEVPNA